MKRWIAFLLICISVLSAALIGCGANDNSPKSEPIFSPEGSKTDDDSNVDNNIDNNDDSNVGNYFDNNDDNSVIINKGTQEEATNTPGDHVINVWSYNDDASKIFTKFSELNPDFDYTFNITELPLIDDYQGALNQALAAGDSSTPDIYTVESSYVINYTQGDAYQYAADYKELGIDVDALVKKASIPSYIIDLGTNPEGKLVSLGYQSAVGVFLYRRSIAKDTWGTDDPSIIKDMIGPGWNKFFEAAEELRAKGYGICSGPDDIWYSVANSATRGWVVNGKLVIDPKREEFLELAMKLKKNDYSNNTRMWTDEWYDGMKGAGKKKIFGFFGPAWFLNYVLTLECGGDAVGKGTYGDWAVCEPPVGFYLGGSFVLANKNSRDKAAIGEVLRWITLDTQETGLQYLWANGKLGNGVKDTVASATVMKNSDGALDILGGQNFFDAYIASGDLVNGKNVTKYDSTMNYYWLEQVKEYVGGNKSREQAITDFKKQVSKNLDIIVE